MVHQHEGNLKNVEIWESLKLNVKNISIFGETAEKFSVLYSPPITNISIFANSEPVSPVLENLLKSNQYQGKGGIQNCPIIAGTLRRNEIQY